IDKFLKNSPDVEITVKEGYSGTLTESVISGQLDAAIINRVRGQSGVLAHPVVNERLCAIVGASSKFNATRPVKVSQIADMKLILPTSQNGLRALINKQAQPDGVILKPAVALDGLLAIVDLVR